MASQLRERHGSDRLAILMPRTNAGTHTYDGIELCAERVVREVEDELARLEQQAQPARRLSIVGYSLGGLIARYVVGILLHNGWLDRLEPVVSARGWHGHGHGRGRKANAGAVELHHVR